MYDLCMIFIIYDLRYATFVLNFLRKSFVHRTFFLSQLTWCVWFPST